MRVVAEHYNYHSTSIIMRKIKSGRRAMDSCVARATLVMLNFELGHEEDICTMDLREYLSTTLSTL